MINGTEKLAQISTVTILLQYNFKQAVMSENTSKTIHHYILLFTSLLSVEPKHDLHSSAITHDFLDL